jgi:predicted TIM-barrel fold metal-dependent hydrolase
MIVDVHGHLLPPTQLYLYREMLIGTRGHYGKNADAKMGDPRTAKPSDADQRDAAERHVRFLDAVGTDVQLISMRPYTLMHSEKPAKIVHWWAEAVNNSIAAQSEMFPTRLQGVANLPQVWGEPISVTFDELDRCMNDLGFVGVLVNPDPSEGRAAGEVPSLADEYWYPLYEKLVAYGAPMIIHSCGCVSERESQSLHFINEESIAVLKLAESGVFETFPDLKVVVPHGGGAIPYQLGRFGGIYWEGMGKSVSFHDAIKSMYFDTSLYTRDAMELLFKVMGPEHICFGTERPGDGGGTVNENGKARDRDDLKRVIDDLPYSDAEKAMVLGGNALEIYPRLRKNLEQHGVAL